MKQKTVNRIILFFLICCLLVNSFPTTSLGSVGGSLDDALWSDGNYLYMGMEDGVKPTTLGSTFSINGSSLMDGVYCLNYTGGDGYIFEPNWINPSSYQISFLFKEDISLGDAIRLYFSDEDGFDSFYFVIQNSGGVVSAYLGKSDPTLVYYFTMVPIKDVVYTLCFSDIDWVNKVFDVTLSNSTSSETYNDFSFYHTIPGGYLHQFKGFKNIRLNIDTISLYLDDWTVGTACDISTGSSSSITMSSATISGGVVNDGSTYQNGTQDNLSCSILYDTRSSPLDETSFAILRPDAVKLDTGMVGFPNTGTNAYLDINEETLDDDSYIYYHSVGWMDEPYLMNNSYNYNDIISITVTLVAKVNNSLNDNSWVNVAIKNNTDDSILLDISDDQWVTNDTNWHYINFTSSINYAGDAFTMDELNNCYLDVFIYNGNSLYNTSISQVYISIYNHYNYTYNLSISGDYTGESLSDTITGLTTPGMVYYYRVYGETNYTNSSSYSYGDEQSFLTRPEAPTSTSFTFANSISINLTWTKGTGANNTVIIKKTTGMPTSITDGTIIYNGTLNYHILSIVKNTPYYIRSWSYTNWSNPTLYQFSTNYSNFTVGGLYINCYDETNGTNLTFNVTIVNKEGTETYSNHTLTNTHFINTSLCPTGDDVSILVGSWYHNQRRYYLDIYPNIFYLLDAYLAYTPIEEAPIGGNESELYVCQVINEVGQTLSDVHVKIYGLINATSYELISEIYTDGNGRFSVWLLPGKLYKINLTKDLYQDAYVDYIPQPPDIYGNTIGGIFKMYLETWTPPPVLIESEHITFTGQRTNTTLYLNYTDDLTNTTNTTIYVYETINGTTTLYTTIANTSENTLHIVITGVTSTYDYTAIIYINHTNFGNIAHTVFMPRIKPIEYMSETSKPGYKLDNFLTVLIGYNPFGWLNLLLFFFLVAGMYYTDEKFAGVIMMFLGGIFLLLNIAFGFSSTLFTVAGGAIPLLFIIIGVMYQWVQHKKKVIA